MSRGTPLVTTRADFAETAADSPAGARIPVEARVSVEDPFLAYRRARSGPGGVYLETTGGQSGWGYFATDPVSRLQVGPTATPVDDGAPRRGDARPGGL